MVLKIEAKFIHAECNCYNSSMAIQWIKMMVVVKVKNTWQ